MVEFALVAPVLFLLLFGIVEFGWAFGQHLDVRHGAREASRLAAVNYMPTAGLTPTQQTTAIRNEVCNRMGLDDDVEVDLQFVSPGTGQAGELARVTVQGPLDQLTGFLDFALGGIDLRSAVETRLERTASWSATEGSVACP